VPGDGSLFQRADRKWVAQLSIGTRTDRRYLRRIRSTKREAIAALDELKHERLTGLVPSRQSLGSYLRSWLEQTVRPTVTPNTARGYEDAIAHFDSIAHIALIDLRAEHIERACNAMRARRFVGRGKFVDLGPASPKTVRNAQLMLRTALEQAATRGHVRRNEARFVRLRAVHRVRADAITPELAAGVLRAIEGDRYEAAYALTMAGFRANEALGLARSDVDLDAGTVTIHHQLRGSGQKAEIAPTKTKASAEPVDLPEFVLRRVRDHIERTDPVALLFTTERGFAVNGSWFTKHFQAMLREAGLPRLTVQNLRAGASELLALMGAHPSVARDFLRHANVATTLTHYTRTSPGQRKEAARLLDQAIEGVTR
jgi:integrase